MAEAGLYARLAEEQEKDDVRSKRESASEEPADSVAVGEGV
jgi:hypothetical protein